MKRLLLFLMMIVCAATAWGQYHVGDVYTASDGNRGVVYYLSPDGTYGWAVALQDASSGCAWGGDNTFVPGLTIWSSIYVPTLLGDTAGYENTQAILAYQGTGTGYAASQVDFEDGWVLPSAAQLMVLFSRLSQISSAIINAHGTNMAQDWYWSSSEYSQDKAWRANFGNIYTFGLMDYVSKGQSCRVRAVCRFANTPVQYNNTLTYQWSTGSTDPFISVAPRRDTSYTVTAYTPRGCSSTAQQSIQVSTVVTQAEYDTVCQGAGFHNDHFDLTAGETSVPGELIRVYTNTNSLGCLYTDTLRLRVLPRDTVHISHHACDEYVWNGTTYTHSGIYMQSFAKLHGCDSVVVLDLTIGHTTYADTVVSACDRFDWYEHVGITESCDNLTHTFTNASGCDSVVTLRLTIRSSSPVTDTIEGDTHVCQNETFQYVLHTLDETSPYRWQVPAGVAIVDGQGTNSVGLRFSSFAPAIAEIRAVNELTCGFSSIDVESYPTFYVPYVDSICWGEEYHRHGFNILEPDSVGWNIYSQNYSTVHGCDSMYVLNLLVSPIPPLTTYVQRSEICYGDSITIHALGGDAAISVNLIPPEVAIGDILCADGSIVNPSDWTGDRTPIGIVFHVDTSGIHGWAVQLGETSAAWSIINSDLDGLTNYTMARDATMDNDGYANTQRIRSSGNAGQYPAVYMLDFANGWYLPAVGQLNILYAEIITLNASLNLVGGTEFSMTQNNYYWSSSEYDGSQAWYVRLDGQQSFNQKSNSNWVRGVRSF